MYTGSLAFSMTESAGTNRLESPEGGPAIKDIIVLGLWAKKRVGAQRRRGTKMQTKTYTTEVGAKKAEARAHSRRCTFGKRPTYLLPD